MFDSNGSVKGYYILDGWGRVYNVGNVSVFAETGPYWGWDITNDLEIIYPKD